MSSRVSRHIYADPTGPKDEPTVSGVDGDGNPVPKSGEGPRDRALNASPRGTSKG
jgi:hypothetical protein